VMRSPAAEVFTAPGAEQAPVAGRRRRARRRPSGHRPGGRLTVARDQDAVEAGLEETEDDHRQRAERERRDERQDHRHREGEELAEGSRRPLLEPFLHLAGVARRGDSREAGEPDHQRERQDAGDGEHRGREHTDPVRQHELPVGARVGRAASDALDRRQAHAVRC
jgi:hypothetical protein